MGQTTNKSPFVYYETGFQLQMDGSLNGRKPDDSLNLDNGTLSTDEQKKRRLSCFFEENSFRHILVLTGAGTSMAAGGKTREGLWNACENEINTVAESCIFSNLHGIDKKDIESFLSSAIQHSHVYENNGELSLAIANLKKRIRENCTLVFKGNSTDHQMLLRKLMARKPNLPRVELFTTNYDTLFEQAARLAGFVVVDGFSFSFPRTFSGRYFDYDIVNRERTRLKGEENYIPNVFHLLKLHGSLDWVAINPNVIEQRELKDDDEPLIVYPSSEKYSISYDQPFFEMMSRFQSALRKDNTLLIVLGYGFADKHINSAIFEAVRQNPGFHLLIADYSESRLGIDLNKYLDLLDDITENVSIVHASFKDFVQMLPMNATYAISPSNHLPSFSTN